MNVFKCCKYGKIFEEKFKYYHGFLSKEKNSLKLISTAKMPIIIAIIDRHDLYDFPSGTASSRENIKYRYAMHGRKIINSSKYFTTPFRLSNQLNIVFSLK